MDNQNTFTQEQIDRIVTANFDYEVLAMSKKQQIESLLDEVSNANKRILELEKEKLAIESDFEILKALYESALEALKEIKSILER